jgi:hypothetical protein
VLVFVIAQQARDLERFLETLGGLLLPLGLLALVLFAAAWVVLRLRTRYRGGDDPAADAHAMLTQIGELRRQGGLSEEEYRSIKGRLTRRLEPPTGNQPPDSPPPSQDETTRDDARE